MTVLNLSPEDTALFERLFGPRIPDQLSHAFEAAKGVDFNCDVADAQPAIQTLLSNIIHSGIAGFVGGWRLYAVDGWIRLEVCRVRPSWVDGKVAA
jgi:hypothetical protein